MTAATDEKAGWCGNCRGGSHALCMSARCSCPGGERKHSNRPAASTLAAVRDPQPASTTKARATTTKPVIELVAEDPPPELVVEKRSLLEQVVLLLDESLERGRWHRVAIMPSSRSAKALATRLSKHEVTGQRKLEWRAADLKVFVKASE